MLARSKTKRFLLLAAFTWGGSARRAPGPWPLTPAPLRALPVPRGHFLPRIPRAGRARAELESFLILHSPISIPSPSRRQPRGRILRQGTPAPPPPREPRPRRPQSDRVGRGVQSRPPLPGRACGGGEGRGKGMGEGIWEEGARRPGPTALRRPGPVDCYWSTSSCALSLPAAVPVLLRKRWEEIRMAVLSASLQL